jgi:hypothetical protein
MASPRLEYMASHTRSELQARAALPHADHRKFVMGPDGEKLSMFDLPVSGADKWGARMKAQVVFAVEGGLLSQIEACARYAMSYDEYAGWKRHTAKKYRRADWVRMTVDDRTL